MYRPYPGLSNRGIAFVVELGVARQASLGLNTVKRAESKDGKTSLTAANELAIRRACEAAGVDLSTKTAAALGCESASADRGKNSA